MTPAIALAATAARILDALTTASSPAAFTAALLDASERRLLRRCALARRVNAQLVREVFERDAGTLPLAPFDRLPSLPGVQADSGRDGWFCLDPSDRAHYEREWLETDSETEIDDEPLGRARFELFNARLSEWFAHHEVEATAEIVYHRLVTDRVAASQQFRTLYAAAVDAFDLSACESFLEVLDQRAAFLDTDLASFRTDARGALRARAALADDYFRTARYLERGALLRAFEETLKPDDKFILHIHGGGGRGKTMFLRWLASHYCLSRNIPVARVDFDLLDQSETGLEPRFFLGKLAARLNPQLRGAPLSELVGAVREMREQELQRRRRQASEVKRKVSTGDDERQRADEENEVLSRLAGVIAESCSGRVILVLDTLEDAELKHRVDVLAVVRAVANLRAAVESLATGRGPTAPDLTLILAGRYQLAQQFPAVNAEFAANVNTSEVKPFDPTESRRYLLENRGVPYSDVIDTVVRKAGGVPFMLALYADVLQANPEITSKEIEKNSEPEVLFVMERVLRRIPSYPLRWLLRYAAFVRHLRRDVVEDVLGPHLQRAMGGDRRYDQPKRDDVRDERWPAQWSDGRHGSHVAPLDFDQLWDELRGYASASSWVNVDAGTTETLALQPSVTHPMRRALRQQAVVRLIHRDAVRRLKRRLITRDAWLDETLADLTFHEFELDASAAGARWQRRVRQFWNEPNALAALGSVLLSEDLSETEAGPDETPLVSRELVTTAHLVLAHSRAKAADTAAPAERQRLIDDARIHLRQADEWTERGAPWATVVSVAQNAVLRWKLADDEASRASALAALHKARRARLSADERQAVLSALAEAPVADTRDADSIDAEAGRVARRRNDAAAYVDAVLRIVQRSQESGAYARALDACVKAENVLANWRGVSRSDLRDAYARIQRAQLEVDLRCGLAASALRRAGPAAAWRRGRRSVDQEEAPILAALQLEAGNPKAARELARKAGAAARKQCLSAPRGSPECAKWNEVALACGVVESHALRRGMQLRRAVDLLHSLTDSTEEPAQVARLLLSTARIFLYDLGDVRQAGEHLGERDAFTRASDALQLDLTLLRAAFQDRLGNRDEVRRLLAAAEAAATSTQNDHPKNMVLVPVASLELGDPDDDARQVDALQRALAAFDHPLARLANLTELRRARVASGISPGTAQRVLRLVDAFAVGPANMKIVPADQVRLALNRVELLRVLGHRERAVTELDEMLPTLRRATTPLAWRGIALACDRLRLDPVDVLPKGWLERIRSVEDEFPTYVAVTYLEHAEREFRGGAAQASYSLARISGKLFEGPGREDAVRSIYNARLYALLGSLAAESRNANDQARYESQARSIYAELGMRMDRSPNRLSAARAAAWHDELAHAEGVGIRIDSPRDATLVSVRTSHDSPVTTRRQIGEPLSTQLEMLQGGPTGGSPSLDLVERLRQNWVAFGREIAESLLPESLQRAIGDESEARADPSHLSRDFMFECDIPAFHAVPWELILLDPASATPLVWKKNLHHMWRTASGTLQNTRVSWAQGALSQLGGELVVVDGVFGAVTQRAVVRFQRMRHLPVTSVLDAGTRQALREAMSRRQHERTFPRVLLLEPMLDMQVSSQRGQLARGTDLRWLYRAKGFDVDSPPVEKVDDLYRLLRQGYDVVHLAAPIGESRSRDELFLQFNPSFSLAAGFDAKHLASVFKSATAEGAAPFVVVDTPRPPSVSEAVRQLLLRNRFAAQLFLLGALPVVLAAGLGTPAEQHEQSEALISALRARHTPGDIARLARRGGAVETRGESVSIEERLGNACIALFARDPELDGDDLLMSAVP